MSYENTLEKVIIRLDGEEKEKDKRIAELEKERDVRDLEQQAKGVYDVRATTGFWNLSTCSLRTHLREYEVILKNQAKALKEQGE